jgi:hypothetical protein
MDAICKIEVMGELVAVKETAYARGGTAIVLESEHGEPFGTFSVYIPGLELDEAEFAAKTWGENVTLRQVMLDTGYFEDTGRRVDTGHAVAEVWRRKPCQSTGALH